MKIIILAGGKGARLWPLSMPHFPKQFLQIEGGFSFLQKTILRFLASYGGENIFVITSDSTFLLAKKQCFEVDPERKITLIIEPSSRGTGPSVAFAIQFLQEKRDLDPLEPILISPADGFIHPEEEFLNTVTFAAKKSKEGFLVLFGATPSKVETGYGYIEIGAEYSGIAKALRFIEKPSREVAEILFLDRRILWNTGHLFTTAQTFWREALIHAPSFVSSFEKMDEISLDYAILEKSQNVFVVKMNGQWSDVGSWDSVYDVLPKQQDGNVQLGNTVSIESKNCLFSSSKRVVVGIGLEDLLVVETEEAVLVCKKGFSQRVKEVAPIDSLTFLRPWGSYKVLEETDTYKVKKIFVSPGKRLSLQMHSYRSEHWVIVKGEAFVEVGEKTFFLKENENVYIPPLTKHRLSNKGGDLLEVVEVQMGELLDEEDIVRFEDDYARQVCVLC